MGERRGQEAGLTGTDGMGRDGKRRLMVRGRGPGNSSVGLAGGSGMEEGWAGERCALLHTCVPWDP